MKHAWTPLVIAATAFTPALASSDTELSAIESKVSVQDLWVKDYDKAVALAREQKKNLLVDFTGSDWCGWCIRLDREVFGHQSWLEGASKDYILVSLDYPRNAEAKALVPNPERNRELAATYKIEGYPTILLMNPDGDVFGRTGYQPGGPEAYLAHMDQLKSEGLPKLAVAQGWIDQYKEAEGDARLHAFGVLAQHLSRNGLEAMGSRMLVRFIREELAKDADGSKGIRKAAVESLVAAGFADKEIVDTAIKVAPKNENGLVGRAVRIFVRNVSEETLDSAMEAIASFSAIGVHHQSEVAFEIYVNGAFFASKYKDQPELAKVYAARGLEIGSATNVEWTNMLKQVLEM